MTTSKSSITISEDKLYPSTYTANVISIIIRGDKIIIKNHAQKQNKGSPKRPGISEYGPNTSSEFKTSESIKNTYQKLQEYFDCNIFEHFVTITCNSINFNRYSTEWFEHSLPEWIRYMRKKHNIELKFLIVPERHEDLAWHVHMVTIGLSKELLKPAPFAAWYDRSFMGCDDITFNWEACQKKFGVVTVLNIYNPQVLLKYMTKQWFTKDRSLLRKPGENLYIASRKLEQEKLVGEYKCVYEVMNPLYALIKKGFDWESRNCAIQTANLDVLPDLIENVNCRCAAKLIAPMMKPKWES